MNKQTTPFRLMILVLAATLSVVSCRKMDAELTQPTESANITTPDNWRTSSWTATHQEGQALHALSFSDTTLTSENLKKGLVLVYARVKGSNEIQSLPFSVDGQNWYYQASTGSLQVQVETASAPAPTQVRYFIIPQQKITELAAQGYSKAQLMELTYETAQTLLK